MSARSEVCTGQPVIMRASGPLKHRCPFKDELDEGTVEIVWRTAGRTMELHSLREYLDSHEERVISHEDLTEEIRATLSSLPGITNVGVTTRWHTAGFVVAAERGRK